MEPNRLFPDVLSEGVSPRYAATLCPLVVTDQVGRGRVVGFDPAGCRV